MNIEQFIEQRRDEIDRRIDAHYGKNRPAHQYSDYHRRLYIENDRALYDWARRSGAEIDD